MYCGDETGAFVGDVGSCSSRFGWGGDDSPSWAVASLVYADGTIPVTAHRPPTQELTSIFQPPPLLSSTHCHPDEYQQRDGVIHSFDAWEKVWLRAMNTHRGWDTDKHGRGGVATAHKTRGEDSTITHPLLAVDAGFAQYAHESQAFSDAIARKQRTTMTELLFEAFCAPAAFIAPSPMLASFAHGRQTALVVDVGGTGTRVTPVVDGFLLGAAQRRNGRGGDWLAHVQYCALEQYLQQLQEPSPAQLPQLPLLRPRYILDAKTTHYPPSPSPSAHPLQTHGVFHQWATRQLLYEMITSTHVLPLTLYRDEHWTAPFTLPNESMDETIDPPLRFYELPDGTPISIQEKTFGYDFCRLPELFFASQQLPFHDRTKMSTGTDSLAHLSIPDLIKTSILAIADADVRKDVTSNIILTGSSSLFAQMEQRLSLELGASLPGICKSKVIASRDTVERRYAPWIGGSILSSLGSFQQLWLGRREYDEYGALLSIQRFP